MYYLKANAIAEPLVYHWYASIYLISPAMTAMKFSHSHLMLMSSYVSAPRMHELACQHPEMKGGPFIDHPASRVDEIEAILEKTKVTMKQHIEFAEGISQLHQLLEAHPKGMSLEPLYAQLPEVLRGYVELYYDVSNRPHFRFVEPLLYRGNLNTAPFQSILLSLVDEDHRPFCLSTPRVYKDEISISKPFRSSFYDRLFASRENALTQDDLNQVMQDASFDINDERVVSQFLNLFCSEPLQAQSSKLDKDTPVRVRYFGHACVLIESHQCNILIDPALSYSYLSEIERFSYADLPEKIDYVVLTHSHQDHVLIEHLLQLRYKIGTLVVPLNVIGALQDPSLKLMLEDLGFKSVIALHEFDSVMFPGGQIQALPFLGEHADLYIQSKLMYLVEIAEVKLMFAADANNLDHKMYEKTHQIVGDIDVLFIGMECSGAPLSWLYQPILMENVTRAIDQSRRLDGSDFDKAKSMVDLFDCKQVYVYAMGQEPWLNYVMGIHYTPESPPIVESNKLIEYCKTKNIKSARLFGKEDIKI